MPPNELNFSCLTEIPEVKVEVKLQAGSQWDEILSEDSFLSFLLLQIANVNNQFI